MDNKKIKAQTTLTQIVFGMIILFFVFFGMFSWMTVNADNANVTIDSKYTNSYNNLTESQTELSIVVDNIKTNLTGVQEADNTFFAAINGFKGLSNVLKLPITMITTALNSYSSLESMLSYMPNWVKILIVISITAIIVLVILAIMSGRQQM